MFETEKFKSKSTRPNRDVIFLVGFLSVSISLSCFRFRSYKILYNQITNWVPCHFYRGIHKTWILTGSKIAACARNKIFFSSVCFYLPSTTPLYSNTTSALLMLLLSVKIVWISENCIDHEYLGEFQSDWNCEWSESDGRSWFANQTTYSSKLNVNALS